MKYIIQWTNRDLGTDTAETRRLLDIFGKWTPAAGNILQFLEYVDGSGGLSIVDTDDPVNVLKDVTKFVPWLEFTVIPAVDMTDAVPIFNEAIEFIEGASS